jgi:GNAT superfamily N-acetyltransferase
VASPVDVRIERATPDDVAVVLDLIKALAEYERLANEMVATEERLRESLFGNPPAIEVVLARVGAQAVGFAVWFQNFSTFLGRPGLYLEDLFVRPEWRGHGIGRALLAHLAQVAVARNYGRMEWAVLDWNETAIRFYKSIGARPMDEWKVYRLTGDALKRAATL